MDEDNDSASGITLTEDYIATNMDADIDTTTENNDTITENNDSITGIDNDATTSKQVANTNVDETTEESDSDSSDDGDSSEKVKLIREKQKKHRIKMMKMHTLNKKKVKTFRVDDLVSFSVEKIDRMALELPRIPAKIIKVSKAKKAIFYQLATQFGIINDQLRGDDLMPYFGSVEIKIDKQISIREAEKLLKAKV
jgi:hypothetical protein